MALITTAHRARPHRLSEGTASAQAINTMPRPYLLNTLSLPDDRAVIVAGNVEQRPAGHGNKPKPRPLRLIKDNNPAPMPISFNCCGDGRCGDLGCEGHPNNTGAFGGDAGDHNDADPAYRRWTAIFFICWCAGGLLAAAWFAFFH